MAVGAGCGMLRVFVIPGVNQRVGVGVGGGVGAVYC